MVPQRQGTTTRSRLPTSDALHHYNNLSYPRVPNCTTCNPWHRYGSSPESTRHDNISQAAPFSAKIPTTNSDTKTIHGSGSTKMPAIRNPRRMRRRESARQPPPAPIDSLSELAWVALRVNW